MLKLPVVSKTLPVALLLAAAAWVPGAEAYCCKTNPAICVAVCGSKCCGNTISSKPKSGSALSRIPAEEIKSEAEECRGAEPLVRALDAELKQRSATPAVQPQ